MFEYDVEELAKKLDLKRLLKPLLAAEQAMARMDERLRTLSFRDGVLERLVYHEASAISLLEGKLVPIEDLVQSAVGALQRIPYPELSACGGVYSVLRHAWQAQPEALLACASPGNGIDPYLPLEKRNEFIFNRNWGEAERLSAWQNARRAADALPALLAAAFVWDAWNSLHPEERAFWKSWLLASLTLKARKAFVQGLLPLAWGARHADVRCDKRFPLNLRMEHFLEAVTTACERTRQEIVRLTHADALMSARIGKKRKASKLPQLKDLLLRHPVVSTLMIRKTLKVSPEGVSYLVKELGSVPREITGRRSYRAWGI